MPPGRPIAPGCVRSNPHGLLAIRVGAVRVDRAHCRLDPAALAWVRDQPYSIWLTVGVALLAGISVMVGHAVVLLLNRITGWRFAAA